MWVNHRKISILFLDHFSSNLVERTKQPTLTFTKILKATTGRYALSTPYQHFCRVVYSENIACATTERISIFSSLFVSQATKKTTTTTKQDWISSLRIADSDGKLSWKAEKCATVEGEVDWASMARITVDDGRERQRWSSSSFVHCSTTTRINLESGMIFSDAWK